MVGKQLLFCKYLEFAKDNDRKGDAQQKNTCIYFSPLYRYYIVVSNCGSVDKTLPVILEHSNENFFLL